MGIFDLFRFTPPPEKKFGLFISNYIKKDQHILESYGAIIESGCVEELKLNFELYSKNFKAIQIQMLLTCMKVSLNKEDYENFYSALIKEVKEYDNDILTLVNEKYSDAYASNGIEGMIEELNKKPFKQKLNNHIKQELVFGMEIIKNQFNEAIKYFS